MPVSFVCRAPPPGWHPKLFVIKRLVKAGRRQTCGPSAALSLRWRRGSHRGVSSPTPSPPCTTSLARIPCRSSQTRFLTRCVTVCETVCVICLFVLVLAPVKLCLPSSCDVHQARDFLRLCFTRDPTKRPDVTYLLLHPFVSPLPMGGSKQVRSPVILIPISLHLPQSLSLSVSFPPRTVPPPPAMSSKRLGVRLACRGSAWIGRHLHQHSQLLHPLGALAPQLDSLVRFSLSLAYIRRPAGCGCSISRCVFCRN